MIPGLLAGALAWGGSKLAHHKSKKEAEHGHGHGHDHGETVGGGGNVWTGKNPYLKRIETLTKPQRHAQEKLLRHISPKELEITRSPLFRHGEKLAEQFIKPRYEKTGLDYLRKIASGERPGYLKHGEHELINQLGELQRGGYERFAEPLRRQFRQEILPELAQRFSGIGALGSSAFQNASEGAASDLESRLGQLYESINTSKRDQALRAAMGLQQLGFPREQLKASASGELINRALAGLGQAGNYANVPIQNLYQRYGLGLGTPGFGYAQFPGQPGIVSQLAGPIGAGLAGPGGGALMSGLGSLASGIGGGIGSVASGIGSAISGGIGGIGSLFGL